MSQSTNARPPKTNRPTDPFGGPPRRGSTISTVVVLAALAFFVVLQWQSGSFFQTNEATAPAPTAAQGTTSQLTATPETIAAAGATTPAATLQSTPTARAAANSTTKPRDAQTPRATVLPTPTANTRPTNTPMVARASDLPSVAYADLPPEAQETIALIDAGGPFPYSRDGIVFQNRERILPQQPQGYYHEYTVITPGSNDRGARRIVTGEAGEMYYTADHYASFREIVR